MTRMMRWLGLWVLLGSAAGAAPAVQVAPVARTAAATVVDGTQKTTAHLLMAASATPASVAPGSKVRLRIDVLPNPKMHVYAPGAKDYLPVTFTVEPQPGMTVKDVVYPESELYAFKALGEIVPVYSRPFQMSREMSLDASAATRAALAGVTALTVKGTFTYQACDEAICYVPVTVPVSWTFSVTKAKGGSTKPE